MVDRVRAIALCALLLAGVAHASDGEKFPCKASGPGGDLLDVECRVAAAAERRMLFKADFSGSHDDTQAAISGTLDGVPLACEEGSKTNTQGEDGEVSLLCRFVLRPGPGERLLKFNVSWRHAFHTVHELQALPAR